MARHYTEPKISPAELDVSKNWYIWFRFFNSREGKWEQFRFTKGINRFKTKKERLIEANALRQALKEELDRGWSPLPGAVEPTITVYSVSECIERVLEVKNTTLRKKSKQAYKYIAKLFTEWLAGRGMLHIRVSALTSQVCSEYMDYLLVEKKYSNRTHNDHLIVLSTLFNFMVEREWLVKNPFKKIKRKKSGVGRNHAFTNDERDKLGTALKERNKRLYYFTQFIFYTFIRRTELCSIRVKHIDVANHTIIIPGEMAKNGHQESVVIPVGLEAIIQEMRFDLYEPDDYVFGRSLRSGPRPYGNVNGISTLHNEISKELGISTEKGLYSWKHTGVCQAYYSTGKDIHSVMRQLRHRDMSTTMIYLKSLGLVQNDVFRRSMI